MRNATARLGLLVLFGLLAVPSWAQEYDITFQVDMSTAIDNCQFDPDTDGVTVPGNFNGFDTSAFPLSDGDDDGVYTGTYTVAEEDLTDPDGEMRYKFFATGESVGWEDGSDREFDPTEDTTLPVAEFNFDFEDQCDATTETYELEFTVNMATQILTGDFDPKEDQVFVAGEFQGWDATGNELFQDFFNPDLYTNVFEAEVTVPSSNPYKFTFRDADDPPGEDITWESGDDRTFAVTGDEEDSDNNGLPEVLIGGEDRYFSDISPDELLGASATVKFEVDLRPAFYYLEDNGELPADVQGGGTTDEITGLWVNGPVAASASEDNNTTWATWGPDGLGQLDTRELYDDGTNGDAVAGDTIYTRDYVYEAGTPRRLVGKFGASGYDNEAGSGNDQNFFLTEGTSTIEVNFGCIQKQDGTFVDETNEPDDSDYFAPYDPYLLIDNTQTVPTCVVVRSGGEDDMGTAVEPTGVTPEAALLLPNYPNPFAGETTFEYGITEAAQVTLAVYDLMGRRVALLVDRVQAPDTYRVRYDASGLASGTYLYRLAAGDAVFTQRMTVIR